MSEKKKLTYGDQVVGRDFNPSKDKNVDRLKQIFAEAIDIVNELPVRGDEALHGNLKTWATDPNTPGANVLC